MAENEEGKESEGGEAEAKAAQKKKRTIIIALAAAVLVIAVGLAAFLLLGGDKKPDQGGDEEITYQRADLGEFTVNLSSGSHFIKLRIIIEYDPHLILGAAEAGGGGAAYGGGGAESAGKGGLPGLLGEHEAVIRDGIIRVISSRTMDEVLSPEGKEGLKEEILQVINEALGLDEDAVVAVYFQEFLVQ